LKSLLISTVAAFGIAGAAASVSTPASAQVVFGVGPGGPRVGVYDERPAVVERRVVRRSYDDDDVGDCRVIIKRRVNAYGETVVRRTRVCD